MKYQTSFMISLIAMASLLGVLTACGSEQASEFNCGDQICESSSEFCYVKQGEDGVAYSSTCRTTPAACTSCSCAQDDVESDCEVSSGGVVTLTYSCQQDNDQITVVCTD